jgi:hypothetical protein
LGIDLRLSASICGRIVSKEACVSESQRSVTPTASELRQMRSADRDAILRTAAAQAENEYRNNIELTAFEAFEGGGSQDGESYNR